MSFFSFSNFHFFSVVDRFFFVLSFFSF